MKNRTQENFMHGCLFAVAFGVSAFVGERYDYIYVIAVSWGLGLTSVCFFIASIMGTPKKKDEVK